MPMSAAEVLEHNEKYVNVRLRRKDALCLYEQVGKLTPSDVSPEAYEALERALAHTRERILDRTPLLSVYELDNEIAREQATDALWRSTHPRPGRRVFDGPITRWPMPMPTDA